MYFLCALRDCFGGGHFVAAAIYFYSTFLTALAIFGRCRYIHAKEKPFKCGK